MFSLLLASCRLQWSGFQLPAWCYRQWHIIMKTHTHTRTLTHTHMRARTITLTHMFTHEYRDTQTICCFYSWCQLYLGVQPDSVFHRLSLCAHSFALSLYFWVRWHVQLLLVSSQKYSDWIWHGALLKKSLYPGYFDWCGLIERHDGVSVYYRSLLDGGTSK